MMMTRTLTLFCLIALLPAAPALAQTPDAAAAPGVGGGTALRAGDAIRIRIWREPDLSGEFTVDPSGVAIIPKIGPQKVTDTEPDELRERLTLEFERYLRNPAIEITFLRRINILGSVRAPGLYPVDPTMSVFDALAMAGGTTPDARRNRIQLVRGADVMTTDISRGTRIADLPIHSGDHLYVPEQSWLSRNFAIVVTGSISMISLLITLTR
jgi:polysaccharide biosynthesis/export protein